MHFKKNGGTMELVEKLIRDMEGRYDVTDKLFIKRLALYTGFYIYNHYEKISDYEKDISIFLLGEPRTYDIRFSNFLNSKIAVVGLGGIGMNFLYWMILNGYWANKMIIFEYDSMELSNCLRYMPFNPYGEKPKIYLAQRMCSVAGVNASFEHKRLNKDDLDKYADYIFIGAPDIPTRNMIAQSGANYIFILHQNDQFYIFSNLNNKYEIWKTDGIPLQETYGIIKLSEFIDKLYNVFYDVYALLK